MTETVIIKAHDDHVLQRTAMLKFFRRKRGEVKTADGYMIPVTLIMDIEQILKYLDEEVRRSRMSRGWYKDPDKLQWFRDRAKIAGHLKGVDRKAVYPHNEWFWNRVFLKLAILLQVAKTRPSPTQLLIESFKETIDERIRDVDGAIETTGKVIETAAEAGERAWSTLKIVGVVGASLVGAAIVLPPIIRAFRD